ncbi:MAG: hypothetical protein ABIH50_05915 [bacterium]
MFGRLFASVPNRSGIYTKEEGVQRLSIEVLIFHINGPVAKLLGIKKEWLEPGIYVCVAKKEGHDGFVSGHWLARHGSAGSQVDTKIESRQVLIPDDADMRTLCHAILLDGFNNAKEESLNFRGAPFAYLVAEAVNAQAGIRFFNEVSRRSGTPLNPESSAFIAESFAYGGTKVLMARLVGGEEKKSVSEVPARLRRFFLKNLCA